MLYVQCTVVHRAARIQLVLSYSAVESDLARAKSVSAVAAFESVWARIAESHISHWYTELPDFDRQGVEQSGQAPGIPEDWEGLAGQSEGQGEGPGGPGEGQGEGCSESPNKNETCAKGPDTEDSQCNWWTFFRFLQKLGLTRKALYTLLLYVPDSLPAGY